MGFFAHASSKSTVPVVGVECVAQIRMNSGSRRNICFGQSTENWSRATKCSGSDIVLLEQPFVLLSTGSLVVLLLLLLLPASQPPGLSSHYHMAIVEETTVVVTTTTTTTSSLAASFPCKLVSNPFPTLCTRKGTGSKETDYPRTRLIRAHLIYVVGPQNVVAN